MGEHAVEPAMARVTLNRATAAAARVTATVGWHADSAELASRTVRAARSTEATSQAPRTVAAAAAASSRRRGAGSTFDGHRRKPERALCVVRARQSCGALCD